MSGPPTKRLGTGKPEIWVSETGGGGGERRVLIPGRGPLLPVISEGCGTGCRAAWASGSDGDCKVRVSREVGSQETLEVDAGV